MLHSEPPPEFSGQLAEAIQAGYPTLKIFTTNILPGAQRPHDRLRRHLGGVPGAGEGRRARRHPRGRQRHRHAHVCKAHPREPGGFHNLAEVHNQLSEDLSFRRVLRLAESVPGTALYMMHVSAGTGVEAIAEARRKGLPIYGETLHQYLLYSAEDYKRPNGQIYHTYPSLKSADDQKALWHGTTSDTIHCVATDELCCTLKDKTVGKRIDDTTGGNSGVEPRVARHVHRDGRAPRLFALAVRRSGLDQRRQDHGALSEERRDRGRQRRRHRHPRSDAARQGARRRPARDRLHAWEGHDIFAWPVVTILRGKVMVENGRYFGSPSDGRYLKRKISSDILNGVLPLSEAAEPTRCCELLAQSLMAWRVAGSVGARRRRARDRRKRQGHPDRARARRICRSAGWSRSMAASARAISLVAVLRQVREALDPGYAASRVRVAVAPLVPS